LSKEHSTGLKVKPPLYEQQRMFKTTGELRMASLMSKQRY